MRLKFWKWVHNRLEGAWHWVYYHKVKPLTHLPAPNRNFLYFSEEITIEEAKLRFPYIAEGAESVRVYRSTQ